MADKLTFSLVAPERELFHGLVDQVVAPGEDGDFGVLPGHAPLMSTLRPGAIRVLDGGSERKIFVYGGFADVTPDGLTILAEEALDVAEINSAQVAADLKNAEEDFRDAKDDQKKLEAQRKIERLRALQAVAA
jgi:F-type H+-transporting ATPase subunit epsilon